MTRGVVFGSGLALCVLAGCGSSDSPATVAAKQKDAGTQPQHPDAMTKCEPRSCASAGAECGSISDGCGGTLECGTCTGPETCGAKSPNVCGVPMSWTVVELGGGYAIWDIWGTRADDLWAVTEGSQLLHYGGAAWQLMAGGDGTALYCLFGRSATEFYIGGENLQFYSSDGLGLTQLYMSGYSRITGLWGASADEIWAATNSTQSIKLWNGTYLDEAITFNGPDGRFERLWGTARDDVWVVGDAVAHFDGSTWQLVDTPVGTGHLTWVTGTGKNDVWAVGPDNVIHWDGTAWSAVVGGATQDLNGIWAASPTEVWVVGGGGRILHGSSTGLSSVPSGTTHSLYSVWGTSSSDIWAGGELGVLLHYGPGAAPADSGTPAGADGGRTCNPQGYGCMLLPCCAPFRCVRISGTISACE